MRCLKNMLALAILGSLTSADFALAGGHGQSHQSSNQSSEVAPSVKNKVVTGTREGMGFIGDPAPRRLMTTQPLSNVTKIMDPIRPQHGPKTTSDWPTTTTQTSLIAITPGPTSVAPVVRDHTLPKPPVKTNPYANPPVVTGGSGLHFVNPFSFTAPLQPGQGGIRDHRTGAEYPGSGHNTPQEPFTPNTQGPANKVKVPTIEINPGSRGGK